MLFEKLKKIGRHYERKRSNPVPSARDSGLPRRRCLLAMTTIMFLTSFFISTAHAKTCDRVGIYGEALTISEHLGSNDAPVGGYNETNTGASIGVVCKKQFTKFDWNNSLGLIMFKNSYDNTSKGIALASNLSTPIYDRWDIFGGINVAIVDGYEQLSDDIRIGDEIGVLPAMSGGLIYNFTDNLSFRGTVNVIPAIGSADGVILPTLGVQYLY